VWTVAADGGLTPLAKFDGQPRPGGAAGFSPLTGLAFSPDGRLLATAGADAVVRVWDVQTKAEVRGLRGHTDWATAVAFSPDGRLLASAGADRAARVFELPQEGTAAGHLLRVNAVAVSPDGSRAVTASIDQTMKVWDLATGRELATLIGNADEPLAVAFLGKDRVVLGGRRDGNPSVGQLHFWAADPPRQAKAVPTGAVYTLAAAADGSKAAAWVTRPAAAGPALSSYEVYDRDGNIVTTLADKARSVTAAAFAADLSWAAAGDESGTVRLWDLATKDRVGADWPLFANAVGDLGLTPDRKYLAAIDAKGLVKVADVANRETLGSAQAHAGGVRGLVVSPKGDTFATLSADREVKVWSLADPKALKEVRAWVLGAGVNGVAYTPDGKRLVTANADGTAFVLDLP
jgi:WD40 repeat protein